jgi:hypothetical protein
MSGPVEGKLFEAWTKRPDGHFVSIQKMVPMHIIILCTNRLTTIDQSRGLRKRRLASALRRRNGMHGGLQVQITNWTLLARVLEKPTPGGDNRARVQRESLAREFREAIEDLYDRIERAYEQAATRQRRSVEGRERSPGSRIRAETFGSTTHHTLSQPRTLVETSCRWLRPG